jgi:hypothetical protein
MPQSPIIDFTMGADPELCCSKGQEVIEVLVMSMKTTIWFRW